MSEDPFHTEFVSWHVSYRECSLGFEKKSFLADSDLMIESGLADSTSGSIDILRLMWWSILRSGWNRLD